MYTEIIMRIPIQINAVFLFFLDLPPTYAFVVENHFKILCVPLCVFFPPGILITVNISRGLVSLQVQKEVVNECGTWRNN